MKRNNPTFYYNKIFKSDILYTLIFFSAYLLFFVNQKSGLFFTIGFISSFVFVYLRRVIFYSSVTYSLLTFIPLVAGYYFNGKNETMGFLMGSSIALFLMTSHRTFKHFNKISPRKLKDFFYTLRICFALQFFFSFYFFYEIFVKSIAGQNKLVSNNTLIGTIILLIIINPIIKFFIEKISKLDKISKLNLLVLIFTLIIFVYSYFVFIEINPINILLSAVFIYLNNILIIHFRDFLVIKNKDIKKIIYYTCVVVVTIILGLYIPYRNLQIFSLLFTMLFNFMLKPQCLKNKTISNTENLRIILQNTFLLNIFFVLAGLAVLSFNSIIINVNILEIENYLFLLLGIIIVFNFKNLNLLVSYLAKKTKENWLYNAIILTSIFGGFVLLQYNFNLKGLIAFLFGLIGYFFVRENLDLKISLNKSKQINYIYLKNSILNLITIISLCLMLIRI